MVCGECCYRDGPAALYVLVRVAWQHTLYRGYQLLAWGADGAAQDASCIIVDELEGIAAFGVFDGHGGSQASVFAAELLVRLVVGLLLLVCHHLRELLPRAGGETALLPLLLPVHLLMFQEQPSRLGWGTPCGRDQPHLCCPLMHVQRRQMSVHRPSLLCKHSRLPHPPDAPR